MGASGKDYMRKCLEDRGYSYAVSFTTRPPRSNEIEGKDYFFLTKDYFKQLIDENHFYEYVVFNEWYYGTSNDQFYNDKIFIMTPKGLSHVSEKDREESLVIFFDIEEDIRRERLSSRNDADTIERRLLADALDFKDFKDFDIKITNPNFS
jgi:guanylate kinase